MSRASSSPVRPTIAALSTAVALLLLADAAAAARIELGPYAVTQPVGSEATVLVPQFDPALGTLTGVSLDFVLSWDGALAYYDNESPNPVHGGFHGGAAFQIGIGDLMDVAIVGTTLDATLPADDDGLPDFVGADSLAMDGQGMLVHLVETTSVDAFVGTGSLELLMGVSGAFATPPLLPHEQMAIDVVEHGSVAWELRVAYTYVPEPGTGLLLALGLALLRGRRRRYSRRSATSAIRSPRSVVRLGA